MHGQAATEREDAMNDWNGTGDSRVNLLLLVAEQARRKREEAATARMQAWVSALGNGVVLALGVRMFWPA